MKLFLKDELTFKEKFYYLMDILISNQQIFKIEAIFFVGVNYLQILSMFFAEQIKIFDPKNNKLDLLLNNIERIFRLKDLFRNNYSSLNILLYSLLIFTLIFIIYFLIICAKTNVKSIYCYHKKIINYLIKIYIYLIYNIILDICFSNFCFGFTENNPNFEEIVKCKGNSRIGISILSGIVILLSFCLHVFINIFYTDLFFLSNSCYAKMSCNYDYYMDINCLLNSIFLNQAYSLTKELFLIYNLIFSIIMFCYYITFYFYYDSDINLLAGIFHSLYVWSSIFGIIFAYINVKEIGVIYILTCIFVCFCYITFKNRIEKEIFYNNDPKKLKNRYHLLYFLKNVSNKIIKVDKNSENRAFIYGIIQILCEEVNNSMENGTFDREVHFPLDDKWKNLYKNKLDDDFKKNFIVLLLNYFIYNRDECPDINFNLSLYHLTIIQNFCKSMYYYQKIVNMKLNLREKFTLIRLKKKISIILVQHLNPSDEQNATLENANISMYYKYDDLSQNLMDEITNDIELSLDFWKTYKKYAKDSTFNINFNKVFRLTDKIRTSKKKH